MLMSVAVGCLSWYVTDQRANRWRVRKPDIQVILSIFSWLYFYLEGLYVEGCFLDALLSFTGTSQAVKHCKLKQYVMVNWLP